MSQLLQYYKSLQTPKNNQTTPTFEDLSIDDNLSELERVVRYCKSTIGLQRLVHVKLITHVAKSVGFQTTHDEIFHVLEMLSADMEPAIRCHLCEQLSQLAPFFVETGGEPGYQSVLNTILPIIAQLLEDDKLDVRQAAGTALVTVAQIVRPPDVGQHVLTIILQLAHEDDREDMRMTASELLNLLAEHLGCDLCQQFVIPEVVSLAEDPVFRVRKSTALNFQNVCRVGGEYELFERLMPAFVRLSKDDMYRVRRACAESLCEISKHVSDDIRTGVLVEIFLRLAQDPSKLVKQSVLQQSGMFISTLPARVINKVILDHYCSMVTNPTGDMAVDAELKHYCAYSFPGVLQTVGAQKWPELRSVYHTLVSSQNAAVKKTLAISLHEVAKILGTKLAEEDLASVFETMISDSEIVRMGVIKHLAEFLGLLSMPCRISYLPLLDEILKTSSPYNWRLRKSLASQLSSLVILPPASNVYSTLFPLAMTLLQDPVAEVRLESFPGVAQLFLVLRPGYIPKYSLGDNSSETKESSNPCISEADGTMYLTGIAKAINSLTFSDTYLHRQLWAELSLILLRDLPKDLFETYFLSNIFRLTSDPVLNVRINIAEMLSGWSKTLHPNGSSYQAPWEYSDDQIEECPWKWLLARSDIQECIKRLSQDDRDIYLAMEKMQPLFPDIAFHPISCRGMKQAPGGVMPVSSGNEVEGSDDGHASETGKLSRSSSLSSHDDRSISDISGHGMIRSHSATQLAAPVPIPNLGVLRVDEVDFNIGEDEVDSNFIEMETNSFGNNLHCSTSEDYDEEEEQRVANVREQSKTPTEKIADSAVGNSENFVEESKSANSNDQADPQMNDLESAQSESLSGELVSDVLNLDPNQETGEELMEPPL